MRRNLCVVFFAILSVSILSGCGATGPGFGIFVDLSPGVRDLVRVADNIIPLNRNAIEIRNRSNAWFEVIAFDNHVGKIGPNGRMVAFIMDTDPRGEIALVCNAFADSNRSEYLGTIPFIVGWEGGKNEYRDLWTSDIIRPDGGYGIDARALPPQPLSPDVFCEIPGLQGVWKPSATYVQVVNVQRYTLAVTARVSHKGAVNRFVMREPGEVTLVPIHNYVEGWWESRVDVQYTANGLGLGSNSWRVDVKPRVEGRWEAPKVVQVVVRHWDRRDY